MKFAIVLLSVLLGPRTGPATAATIVGAVSVSANQTARSGTSWSNVISQANLDTPYVSGVTDFDSYIASAPQDSSSTSSIGSTVNGVYTVTLTFNLGGLYTLDRFALWNRGGITQGVREFTLTAATAATFSDATLLGSFTATEALSGTVNYAVPEVFGFSTTEAHYVRMSVLNTHGTCCVSLSEVAFAAVSDAPPIPVPLPGVLLATGLGGLALIRRGA